jgi:hypothetical protein
MERVRADAGLTPATMPEEEAVFQAALARYEKPAGGAYRGVVSFPPETVVRLFLPIESLPFSAPVGARCRPSSVPSRGR